MQWVLLYVWQQNVWVGQLLITPPFVELFPAHWRNSSTWLLLLQQLATPLYLLSLVTTVKLDTIRLCWAESVFSTVKKNWDWTGLDCCLGLCGHNFPIGAASGPGWVGQGKACQEFAKLFNEEMVFQLKVSSQLCWTSGQAHRRSFAIWLFPASPEDP